MLGTDSYYSVMDANLVKELGSREFINNFLFSTSFFHETSTHKRVSLEIQSIAVLGRSK